jgi:hypothetical protein
MVSRLMAGRVAHPPCLCRDGGHRFLELQLLHDGPLERPLRLAGPIEVSTNPMEATMFTRTSLFILAAAAIFAVEAIPTVA